MVECQLPKLDVAGSSPVSRSIFSMTYSRNCLFKARKSEANRGVEGPQLPDSAHRNASEEGGPCLFSESDPHLLSGSNDVSVNGIVLAQFGAIEHGLSCRYEFEDAMPDVRIHDCGACGPREFRSRAEIWVSTQRNLRDHARVRKY